MYLFLNKKYLHRCIIINAENQHTTAANDVARCNKCSRSTNRTTKAQQSRRGGKTYYGVNARNAQLRLRSQNLQPVSQHSACPSGEGPNLSENEGNLLPFFVNINTF